MNAVTPLMRAILQALDTCEHGASEAALVPLLCSTYDGLYYHDELMTALAALHSNDLTCQHINYTAGGLLDRALGLIVYSISAVGCDALWALLQAQTQAQPFRAAMRAYVSGAAA